MSDLISRQAAIDECDKQYPNIDRQDFKAVINSVPSADRPTEKSDGYTEWLEEKLLECEPYILCDVVVNEQGGACDGCEHQLRPECLRKCYEICKGEKP